MACRKPGLSAAAGTAPCLLTRWPALAALAYGRWQIFEDIGGSAGVRPITGSDRVAASRQHIAEEAAGFRPAAEPRGYVAPTTLNCSWPAVTSSATAAKAAGVPRTWAGSAGSQMPAPGRRSELSRFAVSGAWGHRLRSGLLTAACRGLPASHVVRFLPVICPQTTTTGEAATVIPLHLGSSGCGASDEQRSKSQEDDPLGQFQKVRTGWQIDI